MPPKESQKPKEDTVKAGKTKPAPIVIPTTPPQESPAKKTSTPKKPKEAHVYQSVPKDAGAAIPIDASFEGVATQAKLMKSGSFGHSLKLEAPSSFAVVKTIVFTSGDYAGHQAIILKPAAPLRFLSFNKEIRARVYDFYFAPDGIVGHEIVLEGKRSNAKKDLYAKAYAGGKKERVALLAVNREINLEASPVLYNLTLKLESTTILNDFWNQLPSIVRTRFTSINLKAYVKTQSKNAMNMLAESSRIKSLYIDSGVFGEGDPAKAAKAFYADAYKFLEAVGAAKGDKTAGVDVLSFGKAAFTYRDDKKATKPWSSALVEEFKDNLKEKLTCEQFSSWVCVCGCAVVGHNCSYELLKTPEARREWMLSLANTWSWRDAGAYGVVT